MNWIEINEDRSNLPESCVNILITRISQDKLYVEEAYFATENEFWDFDGDIIYNVIAWMPLPEPFKKTK
jgi:hypothetical protein